MILINQLASKPPCLSINPFYYDYDISRYQKWPSSLLECRSADKAALKSQLNNVMPSFTTQLVPSVDSGQEETIDFFSLKRALC